MLQPVGTKKWSVTILYIALILCSIVFLFPLYLAIVNSLAPWYTSPSIILKAFRIENYFYATTMIEFWHYLKNSLILCAIVLFTSTLSSGLVGYAFARLQAPGRNILFMIVLSTMMLPGIVTQIPTYILFHKYGLLNTYLPWLLWGIGGSAFFIFLYRQFFAQIPKELEEAARIDGCSIFRTYWNIFLPMSLPVVATVSIMNFQGTWGDFMSPFIFLKQDLYPLATALGMISYVEPGSKVVIQPVTVAAGILFMIPVILTFFFGQRYIVEGIVTTGVKG
jgi:ABC-type glycerol-3-phosphate transport system permease component